MARKKTKGAEPSLPLSIEMPAAEEAGADEPPVPAEMRKTPKEPEPSEKYGVDDLEEAEAPPHTPTEEENDLGFQEEQKSAKPEPEAPAPRKPSKSDRQKFFELKFHDLDRHLTPEERQEWNTIYASIPDLRNEYHPGMEIDCIVKVFNPDKDALEISIKETEVNPFFGAEQRHPVGSRRLAVISGKYGGGVFCSLPDGVVCMCNYSYQHEDADFMVGENVMLIVQRYENEKLQMYGKIMSKW